VRRIDDDLELHVHLAAGHLKPEDPHLESGVVVVRDRAIDVVLWRESGDQLLSMPAVDAKSSEALDVDAARNEHELLIRRNLHKMQEQDDLVSLDHVIPIRYHMITRRSAAGKYSSGHDLHRAPDPQRHPEASVIVSRRKRRRPRRADPAPSHYLQHILALAKRYRWR